MFLLTLIYFAVIFQSSQSTKDSFHGMFQIYLCLSVLILQNTNMFIYSIINESLTTFLLVQRFEVNVMNKCRSTRKEKNNKPTTGENVVPRERTIKVNPNGGKQGRIPEKESPRIANPKSDPNGRQTGLVLRCPRENSNEDPSGVHSESLAKTKKNLQKGDLL